MFTKPLLLTNATKKSPSPYCLHWYSSNVREEYYVWYKEEDGKIYANLTNKEDGWVDDGTLVTATYVPDSQHTGGTGTEIL